MTTRRKILERIYKDMCIHGFQGLRADKVVEGMDVTKGALYYHFKNKKLLGYAILEEVIQPDFLTPYLPLLEHTGNPLNYLHVILAKIQANTDQHDIRVGSPVNNIAQEMSAIDEGFRKRVEIIFESIRDIIADALKRGQANGYVRADINPNYEAQFYQAIVEGTYSIAKASRDKGLFDRNLDMLSSYLETLQA